MRHIEGEIFDSYIPCIKTVRWDGSKRTRVSKFLIPSCSCIYGLVVFGVVSYIGKTTNLKNRIAEHRLTRFFDYVVFTYCQPGNLDSEELRLIRYFRPYQNKTYNKEKQTPTHLSEHYVNKFKIAKKIEENISLEYISRIRKGYYYDN